MPNTLDKAVYASKFAQVESYLSQLIGRMGWKKHDVPREITAIFNICMTVSRWDVGIFYNDLIMSEYDLTVRTEWQDRIIAMQDSELMEAGLLDPLKETDSMKRYKNQLYYYRKYHKEEGE